MNRLSRRIGISLSTIALALGGQQFAIAAPPVDAQITLVSPALNASNTSEAKPNQDMANDWVGKGWFGSGLLYQRTFVPVGSTVNLIYHVVDKDGKPLVNQDVKLRINKGYSTSTALLQVDDQKTSGVDKPPLDQANVTHKTDAFGNVQWAVQNLNETADGEPQPESWTSAPNISADGLDDLHSQMLPQVAGEKEDHSVITEFHYYIPKDGAAVSTDGLTIRLLSPALSDANSIMNSDLAKSLGVDSARQAYIPTGASVHLAYAVKNSAGVAVPKQVVKLNVTTSTGAKSTIQATTDAYGVAIFTVKDGATKGEANPVSLVATPPSGKNAVAQTLIPSIAGATAVDALELHSYGVSQASAGKAISVTSSLKTVKANGKTTNTITVVVNNAAGKSAKISITGLAAVTKPVAVASQAFSFTVNSGQKTIAVTIGGKTYTSKITVK